MGTTMTWWWTKVTSFRLQTLCLNLLGCFLSLFCSVAGILNFKLTLAMKQVKRKHVHFWSTDKTLCQEEMVLFPFGFYYFPQHILLVKSTFNTKQKLVFQNLKWNHVRKANHWQWERPSKISLNTPVLLTSVLSNAQQPKHAHTKWISLDWNLIFGWITFFLPK